MLFLLLAVAFSACVTLALRFAEGRTRNRTWMLAANYLVCVLCGVCFLDGTAGRPLPPQPVLLGVLCGALYLVSLKMLQWNITLHGVILSSTFNKLGVCVPVALAILVFGERPQWTQYAGLIMMAAAIILLNSAPGKKQARRHTRITLVLLLLTSGFSSAMSNVYDKTTIPAFKSLYLVVTFLTAMVLAILFALRENRKPAPEDILCGALLGIPNYFSSRCLLYALGEVPATIAYPSSCIGTILILMAAGILAFHERMGKREVIGLFLICVIFLLIYAK